MGQVIALRTRRATLEDAAPFAAAMRDEDYAEFRTVGEPGKDLADGIREAWWSYVAEDQAGYVALWGVARHGSLLGGTGYLWCATTPRVLLHKRAFLLGSQAWVASARAEFDLLTGWCAADYAASLRWLTRWLGFRLGERMTLPCGAVFVNFHWWRD